MLLCFGKSPDRVNMCTILTRPSFHLHAASVTAGIEPIAICLVVVISQQWSIYMYRLLLSITATPDAKPTVTQIRSSRGDETPAAEAMNQRDKQTTRMDKKEKA